VIFWVLRECSAAIGVSDSGSPFFTDGFSFFSFGFSFCFSFGFSLGFSFFWVVFFFVGAVMGGGKGAVGIMMGSGSSK
jgi:hypothetical protein